MMFTDSTLNIRYNNTPAQHRADLRTAIRHADIIGLQEVQTATAHKTVRRFLRFHPRWSVRWGGECPILFRKDIFQCRHHEVRLVHDGIKRLNPDRVLNLATFVHRASGYTFSYANTHIEQQYTDMHSDDPMYSERVDIAKRGLQMLDHADADRIGGDLNGVFSNHEHKWYPFMFAPEYGIINQGLDYIGWLNARLTNKRVIPVNSDHYFVCIDVHPVSHNETVVDK